VPIEATPALIDEGPALFVAAGFASGHAKVRGLAELRGKKSDRLAAIAAGLRLLDVELTELEDGLAIPGRAGECFKGRVTFSACGDHRVAMALAAAGLAADAPVSLDDMSCIDTSYPDFIRDMGALDAC